jgi:hypothetical protein
LKWKWESDNFKTEDSAEKLTLENVEKEVKK